MNTLLWFSIITTVLLFVVSGALVGHTISKLISQHIPSLSGEVENYLTVSGILLGVGIGLDLGLHVALFILILI